MSNYKARNLEGKWIEGDFVDQYFSAKKQQKINVIFYSIGDKTYREEINTNTLTKFLPTPCLNIKGIYVDSDIFEFKFKDGDKNVKLRGILVWNDNDLSYEIDVYSATHREYICLTLSNRTEYFSDFKVIGNKIDNPELIEK